MKAIMSGSTGMVGNLVLRKALASNQINEVVSFTRKPTGIKHQELIEILMEDFENYTPFNNEFNNVDMAFFCIGVYTGAVKEELFKKITVDYAVAFADELQKQSPKATFCLLNGSSPVQTATF